MASVEIDLSYIGNAADAHQLDFYDAAAALMGFQRSLAITTHLVLNDQVITQAPALKGAQIFAAPPEAGSWKITAVVVAGVFSLGTASKDTPIGHMVASAYDYVVSRTLGFHVDFDQTLGEQYEQRRREGADDLPVLDQSRFDSVIEKCEVAVRDMHRPIVASQTADEADLFARLDGRTGQIAAPLTRLTYDQIQRSVEGPDILEADGKVSGYNVNTFKGRIYLGEANRPIPFELSDVARNPRVIGAITRSLDINARSRNDQQGELRIQAITLESRTGRLRGLIVLDVS